MQIVIKLHGMDVALLDPNPEKYGDGKKPYSSCKGLIPYVENGFHWSVLDKRVDKSDIETREQLYWEEKPDGTTLVKKDYDWAVKLMPEHIIKKRHLKRLQKELDDELEKPSPDAVALIKKQRECDKCRDMKAGNQNEDPYWIEVALKNLDKRVSGGEPDKPEIRKKLQDKLKELKEKQDAKNESL